MFKNSCVFLRIFAKNPYQFLTIYFDGILGECSFRIPPVIAPPISYRAFNGAV